MSSTVILACACKHKYQDEKYGHSKRVFNKMKRDGGKSAARCTVCGTIKDAAS